MGYFNPHFFNQVTPPRDAQFIELAMLDAEFDEESDAPEMLVIYDAFGGIKHTVTTNEPEAEV